MNEANHFRSRSPRGSRGGSRRLLPRVGHRPPSAQQSKPPTSLRRPITRVLDVRFLRLEFSAFARQRNIFVIPDPDAAGRSSLIKGIRSAPRLASIPSIWNHHDTIPSPKPRPSAPRPPPPKPGRGITLATQIILSGFFEVIQWNIRCQACIQAHRPRIHYVRHRRQRQHLLNTSDHL